MSSSNITLENQKRYKINPFTFVAGFMLLILGASIYHTTFMINAISIVAGVILMIISVKEEK